MNNFNKLSIIFLGACLAAPAFGQTILPAGTVNSADYSRSFAPGGIISIFGSNLSASTAQAAGFPLPTSLGGASVELASSGQQLPLYYVSPGQINAELPFDLPVGPVDIRVRVSTGVSNTDTITVAARAPKIFTVDFSGVGSAIATTPSFRVLTASQPARPADTIILWMNSMGATTGTPVAGQPAPGSAPGSSPLTLTTLPTVSIDGFQAQVTFAGLTPSLAGLYQLNVQMPFVVLSGPVTVQVSFPSATGPIAGNPITTQANVTIPFQQLGFYYTLLGGRPVTGQTLNGVSGATSALAFRQSDAFTWGPNGLNAWTNNTGLNSAYAAATGLAVTLRNGSSVVYDNNGLETNLFGTFYNNLNGPTTNAQKPGLADLYSMSNYFPLVFSGYVKLAQATTVTELIGYFDVGGAPLTNFDPANPFVKYRMNIWSGSALPKETGNFVGDVFNSDATAGTFSYSDTGVKMISNSPTDLPKPIYRLSYKLAAPLTLPAGEYWFSHDASVRAAPAASSTSKAVRAHDLATFIGSQQVEDKSYHFNFFGQDMVIGSSISLPEAVEVHPSSPVAPR